MLVSYEEDVDLLHITTGQKVPMCASLLSATDNVAVELSTCDGHDVVGIIAIGASGYICPWKGYDAEQDTLTIGQTTDDLALITENGDFVGYWQTMESGPAEWWDPIGVAIRHASKHLAPVIAQLSAKT